jgi:hypothetical protein
MLPVNDSCSSWGSPRIQPILARHPRTCAPRLGDLNDQQVLSHLHTDKARPLIGVQNGSHCIAALIL